MKIPERVNLDAIEPESFEPHHAIHPKRARHPRLLHSCGRNKHPLSVDQKAAPIEINCGPRHRLRRKNIVIGSRPEFSESDRRNQSSREENANSVHDDRKGPPTVSVTSPVATEGFISWP
ncbi:MAG TPA: hypothetical protein VFW05_03210 [Verrucomicrobiae bacterium]|nr:hypothetical protein [Verrucomicrobiae bacterium]